MRPDHLRRSITPIFGVWGEVSDMVIHPKSRNDRFMGFSSTVGRKFQFSYTLAFTTGLDYRPTCDIFVAPHYASLRPKWPWGQDLTPPIILRKSRIPKSARLPLCIPKPWRENDTYVGKAMARPSGCKAEAKKWPWGQGLTSPMVMPYYTNRGSHNPVNCRIVGSICIYMYIYLFVRHWCKSLCKICASIIYS